MRTCNTTKFSDMRKRRTASKAPQTPVRSRTKQTEARNEVAVTPTQDLSIMGLSKEDLFMCSQSQTMNSQIDVKWDCNSPDALRQIQLTRSRGLHSNNIDDLVMNLANDVPVEEECNQTPLLLGLWMSNKEELGQTSHTTSANQKLRRSERRRRTRRPSCEKSSVNAKKLVQQLELALHKHRECDEEAICEDEQKPACKSPRLPDTEAVCKNDLHLPDLSRDLFESMDVRVNRIETCSDKDKIIEHSTKSNIKTSSGGVKLCESVSCNKVLACSSPARLETVSEENEGWSDDDLFADDSFILKAAYVEFPQTPNPTPPRTTRLSKRKSLQTSPSEPKVKTKRYTFSLNDSVNPIPNNTGAPVPMIVNGTCLKQKGTEQLAGKAGTVDTKTPCVPGTTNTMAGKGIDNVEPKTNSKIEGKLSAQLHSNIGHNSHRSRTHSVTWEMKQEMNKCIPGQLNPNVKSSPSAHTSAPSGTHTKTGRKSVTVLSNSTVYPHGYSAVDSSSGFSDGFEQLSSSQSLRNVARSPSRSFRRHNTFPCPSKENTGMNSGSSYSSCIPSSQNKLSHPPVQHNGFGRNKLSSIVRCPQINLNNNNNNKAEVNQLTNRHVSSFVAPSQANTGICKKGPVTVLKTAGPMNAPRTTNVGVRVPSSQNSASHQPLQLNGLWRNKPPTGSGHQTNNNNNKSHVTSPKFLAPQSNPGLCKKSPPIVSKTDFLMSAPRTAGAGLIPKTGSSISPGHKYGLSIAAKDFTSSPAGRTRNSRRSSIIMNSFNTSLTDDLLCQLAEPDDLLDSQADFCPPGLSQVDFCTPDLSQVDLCPPNVSQVDLCPPDLSQVDLCPPDVGQVDCQQKDTDHRRSSGILAEEIAKLDKTLEILKNSSPKKHPKPATSKTVYSFSNAPTLSDFQKPSVNKPRQEHDRPKCSLVSTAGTRTNFPDRNCKSLARQKSTNTNLNSSQFLRPSQSGKYHFKSVRPDSGGSTGSSSSRSKPSTSSTSSNNGGSTGSGSSRSKPVTSCTSSNTCGTSSKESVHSKEKSEMDDSFMNEDDDFSTPQVLAMLDEAETQASQTSAVFKCTPDEIEKKKKAALERRLKNQQQQRKRPIVRPSTRQYKPLF